MWLTSLLKKIKHHNLLIFVLAFALAGGYAIWHSLAAPNPNLPGDVNSDNKVDAADLNILKSHYNTADTTADLNGDAKTNVFDFSKLLAHFGQIYTPPSPGPSLVSEAQNVMFAAWDPSQALRASAKWRIAISADPAYDSAGRSVAPQVKAQGHLLAVWGNQDQIGAQRIKDYGAALGADYLIFQGETAHEYDSAIAAGAKLIVGNPNAWTAAQRTDATSRINAGTLAVLFEVYTNEGGPWPEAASAAGVPISSEVLGVGWGATPYTLSDYKTHTPTGIWSGIGVYLAEGMTTSNSWSVLP